MKWRVRFDQAGTRNLKTLLSYEYPPEKQGLSSMQAPPYLIILGTLYLSACAGGMQKQIQHEQKPRPVLQQVDFEELPGWYSQEQLINALEAFRISCTSLLKQPKDRDFKPFGRVGAWHPSCRAAQALKNPDEKTLRVFFTHRFQPYSVSSSFDHSPEGLFTGYYEASLNGSDRPDANYQTPLYARPEDLVTANLGLWYEDLEGRKITGKRIENRLIPYPDRAEIIQQGLEKAKVIAWVDDPVDAFFLHIQGSGIVKMRDGARIRVGYAAQNGRKYFAIGRALIKQGELTPENVSMQRIRSWMQAHPKQAQKLMNLNPSFIFFRRLKTKGPIGAQGVPLTPNHSLAIDDELYGYGLPIWLSAGHPDPDQPDIRQLMIAQDTGGAITGPVRGDVFWGYGAEAEKMAGRMKSKGRFWLLMPKSADAR